ncbi:hypothetical protein TWF696_007598 [Orbilia brochopaga]|uniref:F-box domain-containing protein n=1 Tax=Orbilia brochopaga TaxID=3140254 RepID=A0AAV9UP31_9PEZI
MRYIELPFELHLEVAAYLDNRSLKSLRLACPRTTVSAAAFSALFRIFAIRLGTPRWNTAKLQFLSLLCDNLRETPYQDVPLNPLAAIRTLVLDTRHPYMIKEMDCIGRYLTLQEGLIDLPPYESPAMAARGEITEYQKVIPSPQLDVFVNIIAKVIKELPLLRRIRWRLSSDLPIHIQLGLAAILCPPGIARRYHLDVYIDLDPSYGLQQVDVRKLMESLSDLNSLAVRAMKPGVLARRVQLAKDPIARLIRRSRNLQSIFLDARVYNSMLDPIAEALNGVNTLQHVENGAVELEGMLRLDWARAQNLKKLALIINRARDEEMQAWDEIFSKLLETRHRLEYLRVNAYNDSVKRYLLQDTNFLVALDVECPAESSESLGQDFWTTVVSTHETTLKSLKVSSPVTGVWCWLDYPGNHAKLALSRCRNLEELAICFVDRDCNFLGEMVNSLAVTCPKLSIIDMRFFGGKAFRSSTDYRYLKTDGSSKSLRATAEILDYWKSDNPCLAGRVMQLRYKMAFETMRCEYRFLDNLGGSTPPDVWFDYMLQTWQIFGHSDRDGRQIYRFGRLDDLYAFDDELAEAHFGAPVNYFLHF